MKILVGAYKRVNTDNEPYKMCIVETNEIQDEVQPIKWEDLDVDRLKECVNIGIREENFVDSTQDPSEYITSKFDIKRLIGWGAKKDDFQVTNIYYDEYGRPQLYRVVTSTGDILMCDISEWEYRKSSSVLGESLEELPSFVKKEPLSKAYEWWKNKDEVGEKSESRFFSGQFETYSDMPVRLLYHYLIGVKGFKVGFHTTTEITEGYHSEIEHEYMLFKDSANIKLRESVPKEQKRNSSNSYNYYGIGSTFSKENPYPEKRRISFYGADMSVICNRENYPVFNTFHSPSYQGSYDKDGIAITIDYRKGLFSIYNKLESIGCISKDWRFGKLISLHGVTKSALIPEELALLSARLQSEKENTRYDHAMNMTHGHWTTFNTTSWIQTVGLALSTQFYSPELREAINPILQNYQALFSSDLGIMIENMGAKDALEVMKWTREVAKTILQDISLVNKDGTIQRADIGIVDQMSNLFTFRRNNFPLPDWLQIYSPETIEQLGGVELLQQAIMVRGEELTKEAISILADGFENDQKNNLRFGEKYVKPGEIIPEEKKIS